MNNVLCTRAVVKESTLTCIRITIDLSHEATQSGLLLNVWPKFHVTGKLTHNLERVLVVRP